MRRSVSLFGTVFVLFLLPLNMGNALYILQLNTSLQVVLKPESPTLMQYDPIEESRPLNDCPGANERGHMTSQQPVCSFLFILPS